MSVRENTYQFIRGFFWRRPAPYYQAWTHYERGAVASVITGIVLTIFFIFFAGFVLGRGFL